MSLLPTLRPLVIVPVLVVAAALNLIVACAAAAYSPLHILPRAVSLESRSNILTLVRELRTPPYMPASLSLGPGVQVFHTFRVDHPGSQGLQRVYWVRATQAGFPFPCLCGATEQTGTTLAAYPLSADRLLPTRPIWLAIVANTAAYSFLIWLECAGVSLCRYRSRVRRRLCPTCAYPTGHRDFCTECGFVLPSRAGA